MADFNVLRGRDFNLQIRDVSYRTLAVRDVEKYCAITRGRPMSRAGRRRRTDVTDPTTGHHNYPMRIPPI